MSMADTIDRSSLAELVEIPAKDALATFTTEGAIDPILARVKREIDAFPGADVSTPDGRQAIKSFAFKIVKSRTALEKVGADLAREQKAIPKKIDATRNRIETTLLAWETEFRRPLTEWETKEACRRTGHVAAIEGLNAKAALAKDLTVTAEAMRHALAAVEAVEIGPRCEEFEAEYRIARDSAIAILKPAIEARTNLEAEKAELAELRRQKAERDRLDEIERIKKEAAAQALLDAENDARLAARDAAHAAAAKEAAHKQELAEAEARAVEAAAAVKREFEEKAAREAQEQAAREADKAHRGKINRAALNAFVKHGIDDETARKVVMLIAAQKIPAVSISY